MLKKIFTSGLIIIACAAAPGLSAEETKPKETPALYKIKWCSEYTDFKKYQEIYIRNIDLKDMQLRVLYGESDYYDEGIKTKNLEKAGRAVYERFSEYLRPVLPVVEEAEDFIKPTLILDIKLSGQFITRKSRLLMKTLFGATPAVPPTMLRIKCELIDAQSKETLATFDDRLKFASVDSEGPFSTDKDIRTLSELLDVWAYGLSNIIADKRAQEAAQ